MLERIYGPDHQRAKQTIPEKLNILEGNEEVRGEGYVEGSPNSMPTTKDMLEAMDDGDERGVRDMADVKARHAAKQTPEAIRQRWEKNTNHYERIIKTAQEEIATLQEHIRSHPNEDNAWAEFGIDDAKINIDEARERLRILAGAKVQNRGSLSKKETGEFDELTEKVYGERKELERKYAGRKI